MATGAPRVEEFPQSNTDDDVGVCQNSDKAAMESVTPEIKKDQQDTGNESESPGAETPEIKKDQQDTGNHHESPGAEKGPRRVLGVELAPFLVPFHRRMETLAIIHWPFSFLVFPVLIVAFLVVLLFTRLYWITLLVIAWQIYDRKTCHQGGRRIEGIRHFRIWKHLRNYFPVHLHKTADLDPANNYLVGFHPHGIMSAGAMVNFGTEATECAKQYPGIKFTLMTLSCWFNIPLVRDYIMGMGICDVSRESLDWLLGKSGKGNAAVVVVGGANESLEGNPDVHRLYLKKRKGFIKRAIVNGSHLVPVYCFGETELFVQVPNTVGSKYNKFQVILMKLVGFTLPVFHGRGIFNYSMGLIPYRRPIDTVVGAPIPVTKDLNPSNEQINAVHQEYIDALIVLFDAHKTKFGVDKDNSLVII